MSISAASVLDDDDVTIKAFGAGGGSEEKERKDKRIMHIPPTSKDMKKYLGAMDLRKT